VTLSQLAARVDEQVPNISRRVFGVVQWPHNKIEGNFPLGKRVAFELITHGEPTIPKEPTHVLVRAERVRAKPALDAPGEQMLARYALVRVVDFVGDWVIVARDGQKLGYVPADAVAQTQ
jgi:hypothetical protein